MRIPLVVACALLGGCQCRPEVSQPHTLGEDTSNPDTSAPPRDSGTTVLQGPCALQEVEPDDAPNNQMPLSTDVYVCGDFGSPGDFDYYQVVLPQDGWLGVYVDAQVRGSLADVYTTVTSDVGVDADREDDDLSRDTHLLIPALAGTYSILLVEQNLKGGAGYDYELVASVAKPPLFQTKDEAEPDDTSDTANRVFDGDVIMGGSVGVADEDWYVIDVPAGPHDVVLDVDAFSLGAPGDYAIWLYEDGPTQSATKFGLGQDGAKDPYLDYASNGNESLYFRIDEAEGKGGPAFWYGLRVSLEAP